MNLDETFSLFNECKIKFLESKGALCHDKNCSNSRFLITVLWVGSTAGVNAPVIFLEKGTKVHPKLIGKNLTNRYVFPEGSCAVSNKAAYMDDETW